MKSSHSLLALLFLPLFLLGQEDPQDMHSRYLNENMMQSGMWVADNSEFKSKKEPYDQYVIEWRQSPLGNSLIGEMYGMIDGVRADNVWDFQKYWDPANQTAMLLQIGATGLTGHAPIRYLEDGKTEIVMEFTGPDGSGFTMGHRSHYPDPLTDVSDSFIITADGTWTPGRSYTWKKQPD
ncbi:MAG: hypothetical protein HKN79_08445 [Flavobacteriales bacterium]|nr:hypothetical protein [Flavobacteriales bacterium]